ncbi:glycosyltransferase [Lentzea sp. NEAU-D7]|uniref:glycosyltransferase n=1 Tax=Lentzea sp. NEAU-D7 TaxID=2994667 RepID=UPI00224ADD96|nr:glycosyltransferase [Lentzea sp. NEAU-D7]MCX2946960.1 glycosyltransferase [Lentzea sp. NEAU-D7]
MRIALVGSHTGEMPHRTGTAGFARALTQQGHEIVVYARRDAANVGDREHTEDGYEVVHVPFGPARPMPEAAVWDHTDDFARFLRREWVRAKPDIAHSDGSVAGLAALLAAREHGVPVVHTHHEPDSEHERIARLICRHAAHVAVTSSDQVHGLCLAGVPRSRISVSPAGVDLDGRGLPGVTERGSGPVRVLGLGGLLPGHGFDTVVAAMADLRNAALVVAAPVETVDRNTGLEARRLRHLAVRLGVQGRVSVTGTANRAEVTALLRSAHVVVTAPRRDPAGVVALEAMARGLPVVASAVGALADVVVDKITGRLVPPGDVRALTLALRELVADRSRRDALGLAGADRVRARYGWDRVARDAVLVYQRAAHLVRAEAG